MHPRHLGMPAQELGNPQRAFVLALNPDSQRPDAAQQQKRRVRIHTAAKRGARVMDLLDQIAAPGGDAAHQVGMSAKIFCPRMQHQIDSPLRRTAIDGRGESRINGRDQAVFARQGCNLLQIDNPHPRIRRRLNVEDLGVGPDRTLVLRNVIGVDERGFDSQFRQPLRQEFDHAAINIALRHDVVSRLYQRQNRSGDRGHARREHERGIRAFEFGDGILGNRVRGIAVARVVAVGGSDAQLLLHVGDFEGRGLINGCGERAVLFVEARAAAYRLGFPAKLMLLHFEISCRDAACRVSRPRPKGAEQA